MWRARFTTWQLVLIIGISFHLPKKSWTCRSHEKLDSKSHNVFGSHEFLVFFIKLAKIYEKTRTNKQRGYIIKYLNEEELNKSIIIALYQFYNILEIGGNLMVSLNNFEITINLLRLTLILKELYKLNLFTLLIFSMYFKISLSIWVDSML